MGGTRSLKVEGTQWAVVRVGVGLFPQLLKFFAEEGFALLFFLHRLLKARAFLLFLVFQVLQGFFERGSTDSAWASWCTTCSHSAVLYPRTAADSKSGLLVKAFLASV